MAATLVGGAFLSATLQVLFDRMASQEVVKFIRGRKVPATLLTKLKTWCLTLNKVLNDAEEKEITDTNVKEWVDELKDAVYHAEDLLDEIATEALRCQVEADFVTRTSKVRNFISTSFDQFGRKLESKIQEVVDKLENLDSQINAIGLREGVEGRSSQRVPTTSLVDPETIIYGRDDDEKAIVNLLLSNDVASNNHSTGVIPIVGMGGVGKTTLARQIYNNQKIIEHFSLKAWVCVSEEFDVPKITKKILEAVSPQKHDHTDFNEIQTELRNYLMGKKCLLILDDVWNENYDDWALLSIPFKYGTSGSRIIVTTRNRSVALIMRPIQIFNLNKLSEEDCWLLFANHAFENGKSNAYPELERIGEEIIKKCDGLPLAAKALVKFPKNIYNDDVVSGTSSGSAMKNDDQLDSKYALNVVKGKLLDSLKALEHCQNLEERVREFEEHRAKGPLSLNAVPEGPRLRLLWASFQQVEEEVTNISSILKTAKMEDWLTVFPDIIQRSCQPVCMAWLENVLCLENSTTSKELASLIYEKLKGEDTVLQNIRKSGKGDLYAELLCFLRFGSQREDCCYDNSIFLLHGVSILEDLVITLADGIASIFLELISVDGNLSNEMNSLGLALCTLSTRALQRLRNEVALSQWLYLNVEAVVSMYEDRFDLWTLQNQLIEAPGNSQTENYSWWKRLTLRKFDPVSSPIQYIVIRQFSMPVKRMKELRALRGWRYYFSLLLELSDISMPLIKAVIGKVSDAISFFLVCLIGRSLGLIYTGIRQSLRWK